MVPHRAFRWEQLFLLTLLSLYLTYTVYPGSRDPFYNLQYKMGHSFLDLL